MEFEKNMKRLDDIIESLSDGSTDLDSSVKLYEEGLNILTASKKQIDEAQMKISTFGNDNE